VKRRLGKQRDGAITPQAVAAYEHALAMRKRAHLSDADRDAAHEAKRVVDRMFQIGLWATSILDTERYGPDPGDPDWVRAADIKRRLDAAIRAKRTGAKNANLSKAAAVPTEGSEHAALPHVQTPTEDPVGGALVPADAEP
jgi:hypothetical protein